LFDWSVRPPLHRFPLIESNSVETVRQTIVRAFGARAFDLHKPETDFRAVVNCLSLRNLDLTFVGCTAASRVRLPEVDMVRQRFVLSGHGATTFGTRSETDSAKAVIVPAGTEAIYENSEASAQHILRIDASALRVKLSAMLGAWVARPIEFRAPTALAHPEQARLQRLVHHVIAEADVATGGPSDLALTQYEQSIMVCFLYAGHHNYSDALERRRPRPAARQLRRAEDYIAANATLPLTLEALAEVTDAGGLAVSHAFRATRGVSPLAFLEHVRLNHARHALEDSDDTTTVSGVARRFGFGRPSRFAELYRRAFGELPSATLVAARRRRC
jgi:AraC-like DNA-binding protein